MNVVLLRIGIDTGTGGIHGPLFRDGTFEYIPIPDPYTTDERTFGSVIGRHGRRLIEYFPDRMKESMANCRTHFDPEFLTFTYGDPTTPKAGLRRLEPGDLLVFYCGLQGWDFSSEPALYIMGYFEVRWAGRAKELKTDEIVHAFSENAHVRDVHRLASKWERSRLVLVSGNANSRLLTKAVKISAYGKDCGGRRLKVLSPRMQKVFGDFGGKIAIQRSPPRWVVPKAVPKAEAFIRSLE